MKPKPWTYNELCYGSAAYRDVFRAIPTQHMSEHARTDLALEMLARPSMSGTVVNLVSTAIADVGSVSCGDALHLKDNMMVSDRSYRQNLATSITHQPVHLPNMPRLWGVKGMRQCTDKVVVGHYGINFDSSKKEVPCWMDLDSAVRMVFYDSLTQPNNGGLPQNLEEATMSLKLTMDGSLAGKGKDFVSAGLMI